MVAPNETAVTKPVLSIVATAGFDDVHGVVGEGIPDPVSCVVLGPGKQILKLPVIIGNKQALWLNAIELSRILFELSFACKKAMLKIVVKKK